MHTTSAPARQRLVRWDDPHALAQAARNGFVPSHARTST